MASTEGGQASRNLGRGPVPAPFRRDALAESLERSIEGVLLTLRQAAADGSRQNLFLLRFEMNSIAAYCTFITNTV